jgi:hypothetical protein
VRNHYYWIHWSRSEFRRQIAVLREVITARLMPTFDSIENEADAISDETWERLNAIGDPDGDLGMAAEAAEEAGVAHYLTMLDAKQGLLNLFAVALHHLVEQQQLTVIRQELLPNCEDTSKQLLKVAKFPTPEFVKRLKDSGIEVETFANWGAIDELRHVANAVKHADGSSAEWLRDHCPETFTPPLVRGQAQPFIQNPIRWPFQPMSGQDLYVTTDDIERYFRAAEGFWREFEDALVSKAQDIT